MQRKTKRVIIVSIVSVVFAGIAVLLCFLDPTKDQAGLASLILIPIWAFSIVPSYAIVYYWLKSKNFMECFYIGTTLGVMLGFASLILPVIIAPFLMVMYYFNELKKSTFY